MTATPPARGAHRRDGGLRSVLLGLALSVVASAGMARADDGDICADRPGRNLSACTVPKGVFQIEADLANGSFQRQGGVTTDDGRFLNPTLKYGVDDKTDVELTVTPFAYHREHPAGGGSQETWGLSDLTVRIKHAVYGGEDGPVQVSLDPFIKAPTARRPIGNGAWEGGLSVPFTIKLGKDWQVALTPEIDSFADDSRDRYPATTEVFGLTRNLPHDLSVTGELWGQFPLGPGGGPQYTADLAVAWIVHHTLQLDAEVDVGLNRATPGAQVIVGVSKRF